MPTVKGAGKGRAAKVKQETLPTPQGRRVVPRVTSNMKAEANRKADLKKGEGKRGRKIKVCLLRFRLPYIRSNAVLTHTIILCVTNILTVRS